MSARAMPRYPNGRVNLCEDWHRWRIVCGPRIGKYRWSAVPPTYNLFYFQSGRFGTHAEAVDHMIAEQASKVPRR